MHPTVKPVQLVADVILGVTRRDGLVLDPFAGSGTTILAAEQTSRRAAAIELDPKYADVAIRRFEAVTGQDAILEESALTFAQTAKTRAPQAGEVN